MHHERRIREPPSRLALAACCLGLLACHAERVGQRDDGGEAPGPIDPGTAARECVDADGDGHDGYDPARCPTGDDHCDGDPGAWLPAACHAGPGLRLKAGAHHTCLLLPDGALRCWGGNRLGELGAGDTAPVVGATRAAAALGPLHDFAVGSSHTCALAADGAVWCWGGQLDNTLGDGVEYPVCALQDHTQHPQQCSVDAVRVPGLEDVIELSAGGASTVALKRDGSVWAWGLLSSRPLADGTHLEHAPPAHLPSLDGAVALEDALGYTTCALRGPGELWCLGTLPLGNEPGTIFSETATRIEPISEVAAVDLSGLGFALRKDGTVWDLTRWEPSSWPRRYQQVPLLDDVVAVAAGLNHGCALRAGGTVWCWGANAYAQLGLGYVSDEPGDLEHPQPVPGLVDVAALAAGLNHTCAATRAGTVWCWGRDDEGQLGHDRSSQLCVHPYHDPGVPRLCNPVPDLVPGL